MEAAKAHAELVVLGGGPGGYTAAFRAADLGLSVILVDDRDVLGGVCLNEGCIPSKALLDTVKKSSDLMALEIRGLLFDAKSLELDRLRDWKNGIVSGLNRGLSALAKKRKVRVIKGRACFTGTRSIEIDGKGSLSFDQAIIAVGSRPRTLASLPTDKRIIDSGKALELTDIPNRLLIVGGGVIGVEMATIYCGLGSKVTIIESGSSLLPGCDPDLLQPLFDRLKRSVQTIRLDTSIVGGAASVEGIEVQFDSNGERLSQQFDKVLVAVGRRPNTDSIGLQHAGLMVDHAGFLVVDSQQRTSQSHMFAIGDVVAGPMLAHKAAYEGKVAAEVAAGEASMNQARVMPQVVYCDPEIAWIGKTEIELKAQGVKYEVANFPWLASGRARAVGCESGLTKLIVDPTSNSILGVGIVGSHAGDLISEAALAMEADLEPGDLALTVHPHPTFSETLAFAAETYEGKLTELFVPRRYPS